MKLTHLVFALLSSPTALPLSQNVPATLSPHLDLAAATVRGPGAEPQDHPCMSVSVRSNMLQTTAENREPSLSRAGVKLQSYHLLWENPELEVSGST